MIQKQSVNINFSKGLDTKTDAWQVQVGNFLSLENSIFTKGGLLQKRNGYQQLASLPAASNYLTTLNGNLTAIGTSIQAYNPSLMNWVSKGTIRPLDITTLPLIRNNLNQSQSDACVAANGAVCIAYTEVNAGSNTYKYAIADSVTGQNIISPTLIPATSGSVNNSPRVFLLGAYFIVAFGTSTNHIQYIAIPTANPSNPFPAVDVTSSYVLATTVSWDGVVFGNYLYFAYNTTSGGQSIKAISLSAGLVFSGTTTLAGAVATMMSVTADASNSYIYVSFYDSVSQVGKTAILTTTLGVLFSGVTIIPTGSVLNITSSAQGGVCSVIFEFAHNYSYDVSIPSNSLRLVTVTSAGNASAFYVVAASVGLASKSFIIGGTIYVLGAYQSPYQPTYFLINASLSTQAMPVVVAKIAYSNAGGYLTLGLPSVSVTGNMAQFAYLFKDLIQAVNKGTALASGSQTAGIYSQTGINLATVNINTDTIDTAEIARVLQIGGGFLWMYDGYLPIEHNFFLYPDSIEAGWSAAGGSIYAQPDGATNTNAYWYQVTYEWSDNQGNAYRSAPSIPVPVTTTGVGTTGSVTVYVPMLRLTYKIANPVKIVIYRWSVKQQIYYQVTSITAPQLNATSTDSIAYVDTLADATILGNNILYTNGGVVEDFNAPATNIMTLFDTRLWLVDAEDQNLLWFSKQVIEATPVEMSDLFTFFVAPTTGAQGNTGPITALAPMDDKLIIFKESAIYYINGAGPDNTGANNQYSQPIFISSAVGCTNQQSIVLMPNGLMFQSNKGVWLLDRSLSANYIGSPVEQFNSSLVVSAVNVPETNQVRFTLNTGQTLMYDYFFGQWGTFINVPSVSSCIYQLLHTFINAFGQVFQESPGAYLDGTEPVLISFTTSWLNLAGLQGFQRAYFFFLLGKYYSPHKLQLQVAYDYVDTALQQSIISPINYSPNYGSGSSQSPYGSQGPYGGYNQVEQWRVFLSKQRCQALQITLNEIYDPSFGVTNGAGFTLSGINMVVGIKKSFPTIGTVNTVGSQNQ